MHVQISRRHHIGDDDLCGDVQWRQSYRPLRFMDRAPNTVASDVV